MYDPDSPSKYGVRDFLTDYGLAVFAVGGIATVFSYGLQFFEILPNYITGPLLGFSFGVAFVGALGHVAVSSREPLTRLGRLWEVEKPAKFLALPSFPGAAKPKESAKEEIESVPKDKLPQAEPFRGHLGYYSLFGLPPKRFPFYPPGYMLPVDIECYISAYQGFPEATLVVSFSGQMTYQTTVECCLYAIEHFAEIVGEILAEIKADKGRAMTLSAQIINPTRIALFHGPALTHKGHSDVWNAASKKGLVIWERHGPLIARHDI